MPAGLLIRHRQLKALPWRTCRHSYTKTELLAILNSPGGGDASVTLAIQLIGAKLNIANYSDPAAISATITAADNLLKAYTGKLPYGVKTSTAAGKPMLQAAATLEQYNKQLLTPNCTQ